ncbi:MAG: hypothetical protein QXW56_09070 [Nitrososphaerota archaeon]
MDALFTRARATAVILILLISFTLLLSAEPAHAERRGVLWVEPMVHKLEERWGMEVSVTCRGEGGTALTVKFIMPYVEYYDVESNSLLGGTTKFAITASRNGTAHFRAEFSFTSEAPDANVTIRSLKFKYYSWELDILLTREKPTAVVDLKGEMRINNFDEKTWPYDIKYSYSFAGISRSAICTSHYFGVVDLPNTMLPVNVELRASMLKSEPIPYEITNALFGTYWLSYDGTGILESVFLDLSLSFGSDASDVVVQIIDIGAGLYKTIATRGYLKAGEILRVSGTMSELGLGVDILKSGVVPHRIADEKLANDASAPLYAVYPITITFTNPWTGIRHTTEPVFLVLKYVRASEQYQTPTKVSTGTATTAATVTTAGTATIVAEPATTVPIPDGKTALRLTLRDAYKAVEDAMPLAILLASLLGAAIGFRRRV